MDEGIRFRLINALIQTLQKFRRIQDLKIIVALRSDVLERTIQENQDLGFQSEKYKDYISEIRWADTELKQLLQKRINYLFRKQYTKADVQFEDVFPFEVKRKKSIDYILSRTLMRPRDAISFVNECLKEADGLTEISANTIYFAEATYAFDRRKALIEEWQSAFPSLGKMLKVLENNPETIRFGDFDNRENMEALAFEIADVGQQAFDPMHSLAEKAALSSANERVNRYTMMAQKAVEILYRVGVVGVKLSSESPFKYSHLASPSLPSSRLTEDVKIKVHPMLFRALNIDVRDQGGKRKRARTQV